MIYISFFERALDTLWSVQEPGQSIIYLVQPTRYLPMYHDPRQPQTRNLCPGHPGNNQDGPCRPGKITTISNICQTNMMLLIVGHFGYPEVTIKTNTGPIVALSSFSFANIIKPILSVAVWDKEPIVQSEGKWHRKASQITPIRSTLSYYNWVSDLNWNLTNIHFSSFVKY